ncbi:hypothetical protein BCF33_0109 [Hasllibacter halocynthiae]|uniref:Uncharacterized protein n=1 Tax=Hasllibacter halocynthiae TaxID=595589 RepID=A0A2T0X6E6_9RHOB|nr:hypothetical protein [Hasllibacter halocynthiae]PRY94518.1 hypothetical protein BCF33_0109 [Hasllibacter halocynthiae]
MTVALLVQIDALLAVLLAAVALAAAPAASEALRLALIGGGTAIMAVASLFGIGWGLLFAIPLLGGAFVGRSRQVDLPARPFAIAALIGGILAGITAVILVISSLSAQAATPT